ncbi:25516_t:CDS:2, partial [Gigaspora rosea]
IAKVLEKCQLAYEESSAYKIGIWLTSQLMTEDGEKLYTWKQIKLAGNFVLKGKKAKWFDKIEKEMIKNVTTREVKPIYKLRTKNPNTLTIAVGEVKENKRTKEEKVLEQVKGQVRAIVKCKELRDILNLVQKTEVGPQMILNTTSLEKVVRKSTKKTLIMEKELQGLEEK